MTDLQLRNLRRAANHFCVGFGGCDLSPDLLEAVETFHLNKFILFRENFADDEAARILIKNLKEKVYELTGHHATVMIDQEGGAVSRLIDDSLNIPCQMAMLNVKENYDSEAVYKINLINARILRDYGVNFNLALVADVNNEIDNPIIGARSFSSDPEKVASACKEALRAYKDAGVFVSCKHFPGHGNVKVDSHLDLPVNMSALDELENVELPPFKELIKDGVDSVMIAHLLFPEIDKENLPATLSKTFITEILRKKLNFHSLVITDCMEMRAISNNYSPETAAQLSLEAGTDILIFSHNFDLAITCIKKLSKLLEQGLLDEEALELSDRRLLEYDRKLSISENEKIDPLSEDELNIIREDIRKYLYYSIKSFPDERSLFDGLKDFRLSKNSLVVGPKPQRVNEVSNFSNGERSFAALFASYIDCSYVDIDLKPGKENFENVLNNAEKKDSVVFALYQARLFREQIDLAETLLKINRKVLFVLLRDPYDFEILKRKNEAASAICIYEYSEKSTAALFNYLRDKGIEVI